MRMRMHDAEAAMLNTYMCCILLVRGRSLAVQGTHGTSTLPVLGPVPYPVLLLLMMLMRPFWKTSSQAHFQMHRHSRSGKQHNTV